MSIEAQWLITATVGGQNIGVWDKFSGGDTSAKVAKHRPGGMGPEVLYRALPTYSNVTISRIYERARDHELVRRLQAINAAGESAMVVSKQPLDEDGNAWGSPIVYQGRLSDVKPGTTDSTSDTPTMVEIDLTVATVS